MDIARLEQNFLASLRPSAGLTTTGEHSLRDELPPASMLGRVPANRYVPGALLAEGTFSVRYRADDLATSESVCIEVLSRRAIAGYAKIRRAADRLAALGHPNIVEVLGRGMAVGAWPFLVTEYEERRTLRGRFWPARPTPLSRREHPLRRRRGAPAPARRPSDAPVSSCGPRNIRPSRAHTPPRCRRLSFRRPDRRLTSPGERASTRPHRSSPSSSWPA